MVSLNKVEEKEMRVNELLEHRKGVQEEMKACLENKNKSHKLKSTFYAYETIEIWLLLEKLYENPKEELGAGGYVLEVDRLRKSNTIWC